MLISEWTIFIYGLIAIQCLFVSSLNTSLIDIEETLFYQHLRNRTDLNEFYDKILQSNDIDDQTRLHQVINEQKCFPTMNGLFSGVNSKTLLLNGSLTRTHFQHLLPVFAQIRLNDGCRKLDELPTWKNIIIGLITVTFINCSALCGAIILPFRKRSAFKWILSAFIGLAVGTLTGSGVFHLIPMAFNIPDIDTYHKYLNKALIPMIIIYLFYMRDQLLRIFFKIETIVCTHNHSDDDIITDQDSYIASPSFTILDSLPKSPNLEIKKPVLSKKSRHRLIENLKTMKAAGWMIFIGDMLHNFIDGLTLGAAFMVSIGEGLRMSFPIICEEFPHELGDIAVLLSSGLTIGQALVMNFISACSCYFGFLIGAKLGELEEFHPWIYALAGGMFVYIGLADMVPELISMGNDIERDYIEAKKPVGPRLKLKILLCQNSGLVLGVGIMYFLGKYGAYLENLVKV